MLNLIKNEWMKIFKRPGTYVMLSILLAAALLVGIITKYQESKTEFVPDQKWEQNLKDENMALKRQLDQSHSKTEKDFYKQRIAINEYRIKHDLPPQVEYNMWTLVQDSSQLIVLAGLFIIIISAGIVASEFNWGTIKLLLIRPINRSKILISKYLTVLLFGVLMIGVLFAFSTALGAILFGTPDQMTPYLNYHNGQVTEQNIVIHLVIFYGLNSIDTLMLATMAFMISSVFRNSSLAIGLSIFLLLSGAQLTTLLSLKFDWAKYILFANTNLMQYIEGEPMIEGMSMSFSVIMILVYFIIFQVLAFSVFKKRDVAA